MTKTITMQEAIKAVTESKPDHAVRHLTDKEIPIGKAIHQGDVYLFRVAASHTRGKKLGTRKLAIGQGDGSHHMAEGDALEVFAGAELPEWVNEPGWMTPGQMLGPVVVAKKRWRNTHPVHGHFDLPAGTYQTTYQADYRTQQRVVD